MVTRRQVLLTAASISAGIAAPWAWISRKAAAQPGSATIVDPRFTMPVINPLVIPKFVDPLPRPGDGWPVIDATAPNTTVDLSLAAVSCQVLPQNAAGFPQIDTPCWGYRRVSDTYTHTFLGPTIVARGRSNPLAPTQVPIDVRFDYSQVPIGEHLLKRGDPSRGSVVDKHVHGTHMDEPEVRFIAHKHGGEGVDEDSDGYAEAWITPDGVKGPSFAGGPYPPTSGIATHHHVYPNTQGAALVWYHDHALGITRLNVYAGMAAGYLVTDENEQALIAAGSLPVLGGAFDVPLVIQDRMFYPDGRLAYPDQPAPAAAGCEDPSADEASTMPEFFGDVILVNGKSWPFLEVEPAIYRLRFLNGCNSRFLQLRLPGLPLTILGTEGGFLSAALSASQLIVGPAERMDVLVDFRTAGGRTVTLVNVGAKKPFPKGTPTNPRTDGLVMQFRVKATATVTAEVTAPLPGTLNPTPPPGELAPSATRRVLLFEGQDHFGRILPLLGSVTGAPGALSGIPLTWTDAITEAPTAGTVEEWEIYNTTADAHPIHIHEAFFSVVNRQRIRFSKADVEALCGEALSSVPMSLIGQPQGAPGYERGFKDTVITYPGEVTRVRVDFRGAQAGRFVWHCHILEHEDHEMMRPYDIL